MQAENNSSVNAEHSLGKGEVESSILSGSTRSTHKHGAIHWAAGLVPAVSGRTVREPNISDSGESVDFVHGSIMEDSVSDRLTQEAKDAIANAGKPALQRAPEPSAPSVTDEMIQAACVAGYGVGTDKDTNLYKLMKRTLTAALNVR